MLEPGAVKERVRPSQVALSTCTRLKGITGQYGTGYRDMK